jgi:hypothetical protein
MCVYRHASGSYARAPDQRPGSDGLSGAEVMHRIGRDPGMNVIGAVPSFFACVFSSGGRLDRFSPRALHLAHLSVLRPQLALGPQPMRRLVTVAVTRFLPNLKGPPGDYFVTD